MLDESHRERVGSRDVGRKAVRRPSLLRILLAGLATCIRRPSGAVGLIGRKDFFLAEKYSELSDHYRGRILDLGAGRCSYSSFLRSQGHSVVAMDVADTSEFGEVVPVVFDGHTIPAEDDSFDVGLCMFVLHHLDHQAELLAELHRVVRGTLIIGEDLRENAWDSFWVAVHTGLIHWGRADRGFRSDAQWREMFGDLGFVVRRRVTIPRWRLPFYPVLRAIYVIEVLKPDKVRSTGVAGALGDQGQPGS